MNVPIEEQPAGVPSSPLAATARHTRPVSVFHVIFIFVIAALPLAGTFLFYYPDERHYTDGAMQMLRHGSWLVPQHSDGTPRFEKPLLAYWAVASSWTVFGVSTLAARLPFILAACGSLWLAYRIARKISGNSETALLAALVLASNPQFFLASVRNMPDALVTFAVTLSAYGFLRLFAFGEFSTATFWMAYGGATLAAMSKGLHGAVIVLFAWAFAFARQRSWHGIQKIIYWPGILTGVTVIGGWFAYILATHGTEAWKVFWGDQVTSNLGTTWWRPLPNCILFGLILIFNFVPWSLPVIELWIREKRLKTGECPLPAVRFILGWTITLIVMFSFGTNVSVRYLLPATPLMSVLLAVCVGQTLQQCSLFFSIERMAAVAPIFLFVPAAMIPVTHYLWHVPFLLPTLLTAAAAVSIIVLRSATVRKTVSAPAGLTFTIIAAWLIFYAAAMPIVLRENPRQTRQSLEQAIGNSSKTILFIGSIQRAAELRIVLGKEWTVIHSDYWKPALAESTACILLDTDSLYWFINHHWTIQPIGYRINTFDFNTMIDGIKNGNVADAITPPSLVLAKHPGVWLHP